MKLRVATLEGYPWSPWRFSQVKALGYSLQNGRWNSRRANKSAVGNGAPSGRLGASPLQVPDREVRSLPTSTWTRQQFTEQRSESLTSICEARSPWGVGVSCTTAVTTSRHCL